MTNEIEPGASGSYTRMAKLLTNISEKLMPLPEVVHTMAGDFKVITDRGMVDEYLTLDKDDEAEGIVIYNLGIIIVSAHDRRLRAQWEILLHEVRHIEERALKQTMSEEDVQQSAAFLTDFMERNGFLDRRDSDGEKG